MASPEKIQEFTADFGGLSVTEYIEKRVQESLRIQRAEAAQREAERNRRREEERQQQAAVMASVRETLTKSKAMIDRTEDSIVRMREAIEGVEATQKKLDDFRDEFSRVISESLSRAFSGFHDPVEMQRQHGTPTAGDTDQIAASLLECNSLTFILGAGLSAESGVLTYKDNNTTWTIDGREYTHQERANIDTLRQYPRESWEYYHFLRKTMGECRPNAGHLAVREIVDLFRSLGRPVSVLTQNIDGFEREVLNGTQDLFELHGHIGYMRCFQECCPDIRPTPDVEGIPECPQCHGHSRPNVLLFGEAYSNELHRIDDALKAAKDVDCLIVVGTQLKCGLPARLVTDAAKAGKLIVEVNLEPVVQFGRVFNFTAPSGQILPAIVSKMKQLIK